MWLSAHLYPVDPAKNILCFVVSSAETHCAGSTQIAAWLVGGSCEQLTCSGMLAVNTSLKLFFKIHNRILMDFIGILELLFYMFFCSKRK